MGHLSIAVTGIRRVAPSTDGEPQPSSGTTAILDWQSPAFEAWAAGLDQTIADDHEFLRQAHGFIQRAIRPVYAMNELQSVTATISCGRGSCSQRLAVLEALGRRRGMPTRVRGLLVDGSFWYPRFGRIRFLVPQQVLLAWPEFLLNGNWLNVSALFDGGHGNLTPFTNRGAETLFDAVARGAASWEKAGTPPCDCETQDLSGFLRRDLGVFASRDELFGRYGQTLPTLIRWLIDPVFSRWSAGRT